MKTMLIIFLLTIAFTQLYTQGQLEDEDFLPPHPDSLSNFIEGVDIQFYNGGEAYVIKDKNVNVQEILEFAREFSDIYGVGYNVVPRVFDTSIKPDKKRLPPLAKTADTSLCNQIVWSEPVLLFDNGAFWLNMAVVGDTVHAIPGAGNSSPDIQRQYYARSTNGGSTFDVKKNIREDSIGRFPGTGWTRIVANKNKIFLFSYLTDTLGGDYRNYAGYMLSTNGGETFTKVKRVVEYEAYATDIACSGDTIAVVIGDCRWKKEAPVPKYIYISTNFGETWKFRGYAGGRRVSDPRIALAGGWLHQVNEYTPPGRLTRHEVAYYRSRVMRKAWSRRQLLSTNDGISSIQGDVVAEPNGFVGVVWNDGKYGSNFGVDGTPIFRRSLDFGKTFEPEVMLTSYPEAAWPVMRPKPISVRFPIVSVIWAKWLNWDPSEIISASTISFDGGITWCEPSYFGNITSVPENTVIGNGKIFISYSEGNNSYIVIAVIPNNKGLKQMDMSHKEYENRENILLTQNYPNPFNPKTDLRLELRDIGYVTLKVYDVLGREVSVLIDNKHYESGDYEVEFDAKDRGLPSGIYYYRISLTNESGTHTKTGKMILTR